MTTVVDYTYGQFVADYFGALVQDIVIGAVGGAVGAAIAQLTMSRR